ncbi:hypothetical protein IV38_GL000805 [Lactobacillus selangorensis]|uniref:Uncharacterized protein n=1 Tax=Lactobacillus selangorensis TaxID=81857 RepID=A0A0R2FK19_9LACO|nr:hypothetical protein [Lactobacillus selangorensis]KRN28606.1 hypothetical protein IV38_GL000805 [Lactobacillus selangorensis]KRN32984.1 hypothetical protein IV40_GL001048 [Lactobacillus selangorensis]
MNDSVQIKLIIMAAAAILVYLSVLWLEWRTKTATRFEIILQSVVVVLSLFLLVDLFHWV